MCPKSQDYSDDTSTGSKELYSSCSEAEEGDESDDEECETSCDEDVESLGDSDSETDSESSETGSETSSESSEEEFQEFANLSEKMKDRLDNIVPMDQVNLNVDYQFQLQKSSAMGDTTNRTSIERQKTECIKARINKVLKTINTCKLYASGRDGYTLIELKKFKQALGLSETKKIDIVEAIKLKIKQFA